jgi:Flp pilus assembly pilin Flp
MFHGPSSMLAGLTLYVPEGVRTRLRRLKSERGQAFVEYILLLTLVAIAITLILQWKSFTGALKDALNSITNVINSSNNGNNPPAGGG